MIRVNRLSPRFYPDPKRVIARFYSYGDKRGVQVIKKILSMSDYELQNQLGKTLRDFSKRHRNITRVFEENFRRVKHLVRRADYDPAELSKNQKLIIGSYFTHEYSIEAAAFFNPSMVEHPDQTELMPGEKRVIVSFRATGEGHISSIVFRMGVIDHKGKLVFEEAGDKLEDAEVIKRHVYDRKTFREKLDEMEIYIDPEIDVLRKLKNRFTYGDLRDAIEETRKEIRITPTREKYFQELKWLASSHYEITFSLDTAISERVIFPVSETESKGIEDARFVRFVDDDGSVTYYATYTAYDGFTILPKLMETKDFYHFKVRPLHGKSAQNKDMAMFPRKINGKYAMISRIDGVNNYIMFSDEIHVWPGAELLQTPQYPWEFIQIGNSGSPLETREGWLLLNHGVGPMREYSLSASLLDLDDPTKEIGRLQMPLLSANEQEREGYVPNVVYSCGAMLHNGDLIIPYAMSDYASGFATVDLKELLGVLKKGG